MNFRKGDKVKFMDEPGGGMVTRIDPKGWVYVETEDGFEIPVSPDKLLRTEMLSPGPEFPEKTGEGEKTEPSSNNTDTVTGADIKMADNLSVPEETPEIFLALVPDGNLYACFLVNDSHYQLFYSFGYIDNNTALTVNKGFLEEDTKIELGIIEPADSRTLFLQGILMSERHFRTLPPLDKQLKLSPGSIPSKKQFTENLYFEEDAWLLSLLSDTIIPDVPNPVKVLRKKKDNPEKKLMLRPGISGHEPVEEVDLHIEAIMDEHEQLSPGEILEIQMARFETALEGARKSRQKKIVFIHGLGQGKLKFEIRKYLDKHKIRYQDASFKEYGYGATLVLTR